jgi:hypothetical protein
MRSSNVLAQAEELKAACENRQAAKALRILQAMVPDYTPSKDLLRTVAVLDAVSTQVELGVLTPMRGTLQ